MVAAAVIVAFSVAGAVALLLAVVAIYCFFHKDSWLAGSRAAASQSPLALVAASPPPGAYASPLTVQLSTRWSECSIYVRVLRRGDGGGQPFLEYRDPLQLVAAGEYTIIVHTLRTAAEVTTSEERFHYSVTSGSVPVPGGGFSSVRPAEPHIVPGGGEITSATPVQMLLGDGGHSGLETIKYSIDGSFPSIPYAGPIHLDVPDCENTCVYTVRALVSDGHSASEVVSATLRVVPAAVALFDPTIPAPTVQVNAGGAAIYFEDPPGPCLVHYRLSFADDAVGETEVYRGTPVNLRADVTKISAWTVPTDDASGMRRSDAAVYDVALQRVVRSSKTKRGKCAPPVICVSCADVELQFDDPPASCAILYTLDGTEPAIGDSAATHRFVSGGRPIDISRCPTTSVVITARLFVICEGGVSRFGTKFSRAFHFDNE